MRPAISIPIGIRDGFRLFDANAKLNTDMSMAIVVPDLTAAGHWTREFNNSAVDDDYDVGFRNAIADVIRMDWRDNNNVIWFFTARDYQYLRGPQFHLSWVVPVSGLNRYHQDTVFSDLSHATRLGPDPRFYKSL